MRSPRRTAFPAIERGSRHEGHRRARRAPEIARPRAPRGRAAQHHSDPRQRADPRREGASSRFKATDLDLEVIETIPAEVVAGRRPPRFRRTCSTTSCASCPRARRSCSKPPATAPSLTIRAGRSRFTLQTLPESDFPDLAAGDMTHKFSLAAERPQAPDRQDAVRDLDRGDALLSQRHLSAHRRRAARRSVLRAVATDGHRLAQVELDAPGRRRRHAGHHRAAQDRRRGAAPDRGSRRRGRDRAVADQDPLHHRRRGADLQADRRHVPGLRPRHPGRQRQAADGRQAGFRAGGRPRLDGVERARPRREARARRRASWCCR